MSAPAASVVSLADAPSHVRTDSLSVVADAVSTAYQAVRRSGLAAGDVAFVVGGGGVGGFTAQVARALGARVVVCDVHEARLVGLSALGFDALVNVKGRDPKDVRKELHGLAKQWGVPSLNYKVFECSGSAAGQTLAYGLLSNGATMLVVGYTRDAVSVRLSNLMAFDATVHGSWGCPAEAYPAVLALIYQGEVALEPFIERAPMSAVNEHLKALSEHRLARRLVMDPRR
jgi:6-hydroxycyclohex-1-ene-1-carbonyl-CoA dehydrogenase